MITMPDDKPSIPSIKLMALVEHKTQNIVKNIPINPKL